MAGFGVKTALAGLIAPVVSFALRKWSGSWNSDATEMEKIDQLIANGERVLIVFWHGKYFPLFALAEGRDALVFTSQSFRGEIISRICNSFGYEAGIIPENRNVSGFAFVEDALRRKKLGAIVVDGPLGPNHKVKSGAVKLASSLGYLIVPISMACDSKRVMEKRWDKRELPRWNAKVTLAVGEPLRIPAELSAGDIGAWNKKVKDILEATDLRAEERWRNNSIT